MKTERQIIDELGEWLCCDMEKELKKSTMDGPPSIDTAWKLSLIRDVAERIKWYRDNCL